MGSHKRRYTKLAGLCIRRFDTDICRRVSSMRRILPACTVVATVLMCAPATAAADPVTTINGTVPPGIVAPLEDSAIMLDTVQSDGKRLLVFQGIRKPGTRVPIHMHEYGGLTCVLSGTMTESMEGQELMTSPAGTCYYMPPNTPMSVANLGTEDVHLTDTFVLPPGAPWITILEPISDYHVVTG